jgi:N-acetylglucosaminyldiphosphoundecaprenol N-acetyl-beta-D-mannosaminyltransferase
MSLFDIQPRQSKIVVPSASSSDLLGDTGQPIRWPEKHDIFGVKISATTYAEVLDVLVQSAKRRRPTMVDFAPVSVLVEAAQNSIFRSRLNSFDLVCPDGQPVRWCLNHFQKVGLRDTVCGTTATLRLCESACRNKIGIYLYGSTPETLRKLQANLLSRFPNLQIVGVESPPFSSLSPEEHNAVADRINNSGAGFVFVGIGSQKFRIRSVQLCVGAAFDFIAGTKKRAPQWMQSIGLEWMHRVCSEPVRLGKRYALGNAWFFGLLLRELLRSDGHRMMQRILGSTARRHTVATGGGLNLVKGSAGRPPQRLDANGSRQSMSSKSRGRRIVVVGPGPLSQGGVSAVVAMHKNCSCWESERCIWVETMNGGSGVTKLAAAVIAFGRAVVLLPRRADRSDRHL